MGLIRSENTELTPMSDDDALTAYLRPIAREMIKTAIENNQNLIVEGCYIPFDWRKNFNERYLPSIRFICLVMTDEYIKCHFDAIINHESDKDDWIDIINAGKLLLKNRLTYSYYVVLCCACKERDSMTTLENFYFVNITPSDYKQSKNTKKKQLEMTKFLDELRSMLTTEQQKEKLEQIENCQLSLIALSEKDAYIDGFKLGVRMATEIYADTQQRG